MGIELIAILILLLMFILGSVLPINIGLLGIVAAYFVGSVMNGMELDTIFGGYPGDLFILLAGVTYFFGIVQKNGTIDLIITWGLRLVRGNVALIPWVMFFLAALLASIGTQVTTVAIILAPIALRIAAQLTINPILMGTIVVTGATAGGFSPVNLFGLIVDGVMKTSGVEHNPVLLYINTLFFCVLTAIILFIVFGGLRLIRAQQASKAFVAAAAEATEGPDIGNQDQDGTKLTFYRGVTLVGIGMLLVLAIKFEIHMGIAAFMIALVLALLSPKQQPEVLKSVPWPVIFMVTGIVTYVNVLEEVGAMAYMQDLIASVNNSVTASLLASYVGGIISAFASTTGFLAAIIPLVTPILEDPTISSAGVVAAISMASSIVDLSPFSTSGAVLLANAQGMKEREFFLKLLMCAACFVVLGPGLAWLLFVVIGMPWM
ncbi:hypothetical protein WQ57_07685 [Mesobacillus campisalis]|uniref:Dicarboxylate carrier MatC N-terminal domain-containing protein n=1 Tax=Mesobacillus campisalis TaxID=1408103 RepID=A0A0M2T0X8_9BACI|nr:SLC13 family permease [Mesobacillus campisalis]KKK38480.1 hypothetical protein WQ57_07685 [Mesobacillus campisalis]